MSMIQIEKITKITPIIIAVIAILTKTSTIENADMLYFVLFTFINIKMFVNS
jgi:uncharacterized membrane protein YjdF